MKSFCRSSSQFVLFGSILLLSAPMSRGQTPSLALSSTSAVAGGTATLSLMLTSAAGSNADGLQWTFSYPAASVTNFSVTPGPALISAGKTISCAGGANAYICLTNGLNTNTIPDGNVAVVTVTLAQAPVQFPSASVTLWVHPLQGIPFPFRQRVGVSPSGHPRP